MSRAPICKECGRVGHQSSRCPASTPRYRSFTATELWFFREPRTWPEILAHFDASDLSAQQVTEAILADDSDGGKGHLDWSSRLRSWYLTEQGRDFCLGTAPAAEVAS